MSQRSRGPLYENDNPSLDLPHERLTPCRRPPASARGRVERGNVPGAGVPGQVAVQISRRDADAQQLRGRTLRAVLGAGEDCPVKAARSLNLGCHTGDHRFASARDQAPEEGCLECE